MAGAAGRDGTPGPPGQDGESSDTWVPIQQQVRFARDLAYEAGSVIRADDLRTVTSLYRVRQGQIMVRFSTSQFQVQFDFVGMRAPTLSGVGNANPHQTILGNSFVIARFVTGTAANTYSMYLDVPGVNGGLIRTGFNAVCGWVIQSGNAHTGIRYWVGFTNTDLHTIGSPGAGNAVAAFRYDTGVDTANTNWRAVTTNNVGGTTTTDTGVDAAVTASPYRFIIQTSTTEIVFWINEVIVARHTTNLPTDINLGHTCSITNLTTGNKRIDFGRAWISHSEFGI